MKRIHVILGVAVMAVIGMIIFSSCKKDGKESILVEKSRKSASDGAIDPITGKVYYSLEEYTEEIKERTGINIYEFVQKPYFQEYASFINDYNSFFMEQIREDRSKIDDILRLWGEIASLSDEESSQHVFYQKYEELSILYFGDNFNHVEIHDGIEYRIAVDKFNKLRSANATLKSQIIIDYPNFNDLTTEYQEMVVETASFLRIGWPFLSCDMIESFLAFGYWLSGQDFIWQGNRKKIAKRLEGIWNDINFFEHMQWIYC